MSYSDKGFAEALELARSGNEHAIFRLQRTVKNDPDSQYAKDARSVLTELSLG